MPLTLEGVLAIPTGDNQRKRYDNKARRLLEEATRASTVSDGNITISLERWNALAIGLQRELMAGDIELYAKEYPARVYAGASKLLDDEEWLSAAMDGVGK